jgi:type III secretion protein V
MTAALERFFRAAANRTDLIIVFFILAVVALMILPLPTWLMDVMIALNITIGMLFLLLAVYLKSPLEFSTLPAAILISTLVRIAITISTTRLILVQGDAGSIVASFGEFVVGGNVVVGLVVFTIIAIAQFIVITKGAERVAEVAARFALDALPGKQLSIDSDLRSGDIDRFEAKRRRQNLERESQYYGAMDGAMKFVKGDAIVSMIIILINLIGGLVIGTTVRGLDAGTAFNTYALLTVGDGLSAQIPALLVAVSGGIVVTRVTTEHSENLGSDLARELVSSAQSLAIVAAALVGLAVVPGFPTLTFLTIAALCGGGAAIIMRRQAIAAALKGAATGSTGATASAAGAGGPGTAASPVGAPVAAPLQTLTAPSRLGDTFGLRVASDLERHINPARLRGTLDSVIAQASQKRGIRIASPSFAVDKSLPDGTVVFLVDGAPAWRGRCPVDQLFAPVDPELEALEGIAAAERADLPGLGSGVWISPQTAQSLAAKGLTALSTEMVLGRLTDGMINRWSARAFGLQDADAWLTDLAGRGFQSLVQLVRPAVPLTRIADTLRHLLAEGVGISQPRLVLEGLIELAAKVDDNQLLADHLRLHLSRPISADYADDSRSIPAYVVELDLEETLREATREGPSGLRLSLDYDSAQNLTRFLRAAFQLDAATTPQPVLMTAFDTRRQLRQFVVGKGLDIPVLAFEEIAPDYQVFPVGSLTRSTLQRSS